MATDSERVPLRIGPLAAIAVALVLCAVAAASVHVASLRPPSPAEWRSVVMATAAGFAPTGATACGTVGLREDVEPAASCVRAAAQSRTPFWVLSQGLGEDSQVWSMVISTGTDEGPRRIDFDSYGWQSRGNLSFESTSHHCPAGSENHLLHGGGPAPMPAFHCGA